MAWKDASDANKTLAFGQKDAGVIGTVAGLGQTGTGSDQALVVHTLNTIIHLKAITNHQSLAVLAIGAGSAFLAIGFALFLIGADGAFRIHVAGKGDTKLAFYATAPGLLCFVLAATLIMAGTTRKHEILLGDFDLAAGKPISQQETDTADRSRIPQAESKIPQSKQRMVEDAPRPPLATAVDGAREVLLTAHFCMDRLLPQEVVRTVSGFSVRGGTSRATARFTNRWVNGSKLRVAFLDGDPAVQAKVKEYAEEWLQQHANIHFEFGSSPDADIRISFEGRVLWSYIGTDSTRILKSSPTMNLGGIANETDDVKFRSVVLHEFGHALGLQHEFSPPEGKIHWDRQFIDRFFAQPPTQWSPEQTDRLFIEKYSVPQIRDTSFDPKSIMLMAIPKEFTLDGFQIPWNRQLSDDDKTFIASPRAYPRTSK